MKKKIVPVLFSIFLAFFLLEIGLFALNKLGLTNYSEPGYSIDNVDQFWVDSSKSFGVWHRPSSSYRHIRSCYDVNYFSNSYGARDVERKRRSTENRVVVLGDSFIEGFGVERVERLTNLLEEELGTEFLNFGTAGNFGTTQELLLYKTLASEFDHSSVLIGMLPNNDFWDDDIEFGKKVHDDRYRPYLVGKYPDYELVYYIKRLEESKPSLYSRVRSFLREFTYIHNMYNYISEVYLSDRYIKEAQKNNVYSGYYDFSKEQILRTSYAIENIVSMARNKGRKVLLFTIPVYKDIVRFEVNNGATTPLTKEFIGMSERLGFRYVDLLKPMYSHQKNWEQYYHVCDGHWSKYGNQIAKEYLFKEIRDYFSLGYAEEQEEKVN